MNLASGHLQQQPARVSRNLLKIIWKHCEIRLSHPIRLTGPLESKLDHNIEQGLRFPPVLHSDFFFFSSEYLERKSRGSGTAMPIASRPLSINLFSLHFSFPFSALLYIFSPEEKLSFFLLSVTQSCVVEKLKAEGRNSRISP